MATIERREMEDEHTREGRIRNDGITKERRHKADRILTESRLRNDELTTNRREIKDGYRGMAVAISLLVLIFLSFGTYLLYF